MNDRLPSAILGGGVASPSALLHLSPGFLHSMDATEGIAMGAWGAGLFSDDTALDVKADWEELYKRFGEPVKATRELLLLHDAEDPDVGPVVILALAMCQWKYGCLQPNIKARALKTIRTGAGLHMWEDSQSLPRRKVVYQQIAEAMERPQPPFKRIKALTPPDPVSFTPGQLLAYRCYDGELLLLWVVKHYRYKGQRLPLCSVMDWKGSELPQASEIRRMKPLVAVNDRFRTEWSEKLAQQSGEPPPRNPAGLAWSAFAPSETTKHGFDPSRIEIVPGDWLWDLAKSVQGPYLPRWIEVGPTVARELSTTLAFMKTLPRPQWVRMLDPELPKRVRREPLRCAPQSLGVDLPLPKVKTPRNGGLATIKRSRHSPTPGDIFVANVAGKRWVVGRVILNDGHFACGPADILVYFYKQELERTADIRVPMDLDLLIPPRAAHDVDWSCGEFFHIANRTLEPGELPPRHVFGPGSDGYYRDAWGLPTHQPAPDELVGSVGVGGIGGELAAALGFG
jgi:hypothetical protein